MNKNKHLSKALHNEDFFGSLDVDSTKFRDWLVTGIFYAALHYYESYFADLNKHSPSHEISDDWIAQDSKLALTYNDYRELKQYRRDASYKARNFTPQEIRDIILPLFNNIKKQLL
ncbi:MAG: hypothetical protein FJZ13_06120 [Candidatus Omnitrophica bacterium]|nr:hypothetical protein [Candidatus Omnitrophota bacterium]